MFVHFDNICATAISAIEKLCTVQYVHINSVVIVIITMAVFYLKVVFAYSWKIDCILLKRICFALFCCFATVVN